MARILLIEDNPTDTRLATFLLQSVGHTVFSAVDAEAGLISARANAPDLILLDILLPGMGGLEAAAELKRGDATRDIPIVALTNLATPRDEERIRAAGCDGFIAKPFAYRDLLTTITAQLLVAGKIAAITPAEE